MTHTPAYILHGLDFSKESKKLTLLYQPDANNPQKMIDIYDVLPHSAPEHADHTLLLRIDPNHSTLYITITDIPGEINRPEQPGTVAFENPKLKSSLHAFKREADLMLERAAYLKWRTTSPKKHYPIPTTRPKLNKP